MSCVFAFIYVTLPKVAGAIGSFAEVVRLNHELSYKVGNVLAMLLRSRLDNDELFKCYKDLQEEKKNLAGRVEDLRQRRGSLPRRW